MIDRKLNSQKGFTLIEMVIVIAVMGVLMGIAFRGFSSIQQNARDTRRFADLRTVATQLELFFARCGHYPTASQSCRGTQSLNEGSLTWTQLRTLLGTTVVREADVPVDPLIARSPADQYQYHFGPNGLSYVIGARPERPGHINPDATGMVFGLNCDGFYCLRN